MLTVSKCYFREERYVLEDTEKKRKKTRILIVSLCFIFIFILLLGVFLYVKKSITDVEQAKEDAETSDVLEELSYITFKVVEYEETLENGNTVEWEVRYSPITNSSVLYKNSQKQKDVFVAKSAQEVLKFNPEELSSSSNDNRKVNDNDSGILYEYSLQESEEYVASLIRRGYTMRRKILTPNYAEVYLYDSLNNTFRVLVFDNVMLASVMDSNELPEMVSYFNIRH